MRIKEAINETRYALVPVAGHAIIEIRKGSLRGPVVANFTNSHSVRELLQVLRNL